MHRMQLIYNSNTSTVRAYSVTDHAAAAQLFVVACRVSLAPNMCQMQGHM